MTVCPTDLGLMGTVPARAFRPAWGGTRSDIGDPGEDWPRPPIHKISILGLWPRQPLRGGVVPPLGLLQSHCPLTMGTLWSPSGLNREGTFCSVAVEEAVVGRNGGTPDLKQKQGPRGRRRPAGPSSPVPPAQGLRTCAGAPGELCPRRTPVWCPSLPAAPCPVGLGTAECRPVLPEPGCSRLCAMPLLLSAQWGTGEEAEPHRV